MKIVVATGLFPPDVGGPSLYAQGVKGALSQRGFEAPVAWFGALRKFPSGIRHVIFFFQLLWMSRNTAAIIAFDTSTVGATASLVGMIRRIPVVIRVGGDFVWESYIERTKDFIPLPEFYKTHRNLSFKERLAAWFVRWTLRHSFPAFNTGWLLEIWREPYRIDSRRAHVVQNVIPIRVAPIELYANSVLMYGRQIALKNADAFRSAFQSSGVEFELKEGIIPYAELLKQLQTCYAVAVPSISEVAPNTIIEAITYGKPFILTKYSGYSEQFKDFGVIIDPLDEADMERGVREIADPVVYEKLRANIASFTDVRTYDDVTHDFLEILKTV